MPKSCIYMPEPSSGDHYTLLPLTGDKDICIGALSTFAAAKFTVASKHSGSNMGVHLKLPPSFGPDVNSDDLINEPALCCSPIWKNADLMVHSNGRCPLLVDGEPVAMESPIKVASMDQFTLLQCTTLTNMGYEPKFMNDAFAFRETVTEMWQCLDREKAEATEKKPSEPMITEDRHQEALTTAKLQCSPPSLVTFKACSLGLSATLRDFHHQQWLFMQFEVFTIPGSRFTTGTIASIDSILL